MNAKEQPLISVIVPVYKVEKYLPACLDSLLAQTYQNFELLLVDDGSPDKCWEILQQYAAQDARVCIFRKENGGVSSARNFGLEQARGEYICFVDSDDLVLPQYLEWLYDALCSCGTRIAMCRYRSIRENETLWTVTECPAPQKITTENYSWMQEWSGGHCWRMLTHREVLQDVRFDPALFYGEDALFFVTEFLKAGSLAFLNCPLYAYLERPSSAVRQEPSLRFYTAALAWEQIWQLVKGQPDPFRSTTEQRCVMSCAEVYFPVGQPAGAGFREGKNAAENSKAAPSCCVGDSAGKSKPEAAGADGKLLPASGRKGMEAGAVGERFEKLIDKSHKKRYILFINALKKSVHRLEPHREPGAAENPAGYRRGIVTLEQER